MNDQAPLTGASPSRADLAALAAGGDPAHLIDCTLDGLDLTELDLTGWRFERCHFHQTDFDGACLEATTWRSCRGAFARFVGADLGDAVFAASDFNNGQFRKAGLTGAQINGCKLTGADFTDARVVDWRIEETLLIGAVLPGLVMRGRTLRKVDLSQADLRKADFRQVVFEGCSLRDAHLTGARFDKADLRGADLGGLRLVDANLFRGATISRDQAALLLAELGLRLG